MGFSDLGNNAGPSSGPPLFGGGSSSFPSSQSDPTKDNNVPMIFGKPVRGPAVGNNVSMIFGKPVRNYGSDFVGPTPVFESTNPNSSGIPFSSQSERPNGNNFTMVFGKPVALTNPGSLAWPTPASGNTIPTTSTPVFGSTIPTTSTPVFGSAIPTTSTPVFGSAIPTTSTPVFESAIPTTSTPVFGSAIPTTSTPVFGSAIPTTSTPVFGSAIPTTSTPVFGNTIPTTATPVFGSTIPTTPTPVFGSTIPTTSTSTFSKPSEPRPENYVSMIFGKPIVRGPAPAVFRSTNPSSSSVPFSQPRNSQPPSQRPAFGARDPNTRGMQVAAPRHHNPSPQSDMAMNTNSSFSSTQNNVGRRMASSNFGNNGYFLSQQGRNVGPRPSFGSINPSGTAVPISPYRWERDPTDRSPQSSFGSVNPSGTTVPMSPTEPIYQNTPMRNRSPQSSYQDLDAPRNFNGAENRRLVTYSDTLLDHTMNNAEPSKRMRSPRNEIQRFEAPLETEEFNQSVPNRNKSPKSNRDLHSRLSFPNSNIQNSASNTNVDLDGIGTSGPSQRTRSPRYENQRFEAPFETEEFNQSVPKRNKSPSSNRDMHSRLSFPNSNIQNPASNTNVDLDDIGTSGPPNRVRSPSSVFQRLKGYAEPETLHQNAPKRNLSPVWNRDFLRSEEPSQTDAFYQNASDRNEPESNHDTSERRPVSYTDSLFDGTSYEPPKVEKFIPHEVQRPNLSPPRQKKRNPSPQKRVISVNNTDNSGSTSTQLNDADREKEAKARRLARFGPELIQPIEAQSELPEIDEENTQSEMDLSEDITAIVGLCSDMCPEPERDERGRKGDLDKHERLHGDRNQTSKFIAVKKYTRTAERNAYLIRPQPVLMKTMDYLLQLLDRPYGDEFLGLYNFLWDRMRAIRMDLRMQHIFNRDAISMLEQMIRLHIVAMHELCEYSKGEGFSEGFDAHLNIEQMNKASVDLFQMYDDHRKKGTVFASEQEFRGYYALLKLDKHPGFKVEPAELSLDLAKMSVEVRRSPEISFARDVSKACRTGNYVSFFRLVKKASFLQGCLMHAHFYKIRTQALSVLYNGFQIDQGMPIAELQGWLAMKGEDIENFVESHGFVLQQFEEIYIIKEGPFVRPEGDPPNRRCPLVDAKKAETIKFDVYAPPRKNTVLDEAKKLTGSKRGLPEPEVNLSVEETDSPPRPVKISHVMPVDPQPAANLEIEKPGIQIPVMEVESPSPVFVSSGTQPELQPEPVANVDVNVQSISPRSIISEPVLEASSSLDYDVVVPVEEKREVSEENSMVVLPEEDKKKEFSKEKAVVVVPQEDKKKEFPKEKLKVIFRKWKLRTAKNRTARETRLRKEKKEALRHAAMEFLTVGPLLRVSLGTVTDNESMHVRETLNIDRAIRARFVAQKRSWSVLNLSELVTPILAERNPDARCLCWKLFLSLPPTESVSSKWLLKKFDLQKESDSFVSVSKEWSGSRLSLSFARADNAGSFDNDDVISGASCVVVLVQENIPLEMQQVRLCNIVNRVPAGSNLPLLIAIGDDNNNREEESVIIAKLGLLNIDPTKIRRVSVIFLNGNEGNRNVFFDDARLKEGVRWLAEQSPLQTEVISVNAKDIVWAYINPKCEALNDSSEVEPEHCISAFNETLDRLSGEILNSASSNPNFWPCPEIESLGKSTSERNYAEMTLPKPSWNRSEKIEAQINAINGCKLPGFGFDLSWLNQGSYCTDKDQLRDKKKAIEECLIAYLTQSTQTVDLTEAREKVRVFVQKYSSLELRDACFYIVPKWAALFRQIFYLRLRMLEKAETSVVYVRDQNAILEYLKYTPEGPQIRPRNIPLDEMIEHWCFVPSNLVMYDVANQQHEASDPVGPAPVIDDVAHRVHETDEVNNENEVNERVGSRRSDNVPYRVHEVSDILGPLLARENNRLASLFEKVDKLQDSIDEKLYFYF